MRPTPTCEDRVNPPGSAADRNAAVRSVRRIGFPSVALRAHAPHPSPNRFPPERRGSDRVPVACSDKDPRRDRSEPAPPRVFEPIRSCALRTIAGTLAHGTTSTAAAPTEAAISGARLILKNYLRSAAG